MPSAHLKSGTRPGIHLYSPAVQANPFPIYAQMRRQFPVCQVEPDGLWIITRYADVQAALANPAAFSSAAMSRMYEPEWLREECRRNYFILSEDPPLHTAHRAVVNRAFIPRVVDALIPLMRRAAGELAAQLPDKGRVEFLRDFADPYVANIIGSITGTTDYQGVDEIRRLIELTQVVTPERPDDEHVRELEEITLSQRRHYRQALADRRKCPRRDLVTELIDAETDGQRLSEEQLISLLDLFVHAGFHTPTTMLAHAMIMLARRRDLLLLLKEKPGEIPAFLEELLRFEPPSHNLLRQTQADVTVSGVTIPGGATVLINLASANRDEMYFPKPDEFRMHRSNIREQIAFGYGPHVCLGSALARTELRIALEEILRHVSHIACPPDEELAWACALLVHAVIELPLSVR